MSGRLRIWRRVRQKLREMRGDDSMKKVRENKRESQYKTTKFLKDNKIMKFENLGACKSKEMKRTIRHRQEHPWQSWGTPGLACLRHKPIALKIYYNWNLNENSYWNYALKFTTKRKPWEPEQQMLWWWHLWWCWPHTRPCLQSRSPVSTVSPVPSA